MADTEEAVGDGGEGGEFRRRTLERVCARRASITVAFALSGMMFFASVFLLLVADLSEGSTVVATADAAISGTVCLGAFAVLRRCRRLREGEGG